MICLTHSDFNKTNVKTYDYMINVFNFHLLRYSLKSNISISLQNKLYNRFRDKWGWGWGYFQYIIPNTTFTLDF